MGLSNYSTSTMMILPQEWRINCFRTWRMASRIFWGGLIGIIANIIVLGYPVSFNYSIGYRVSVKMFLVES